MPDHMPQRSMLIPYGFQKEWQPVGESNPSYLVENQVS